MSDHNTLLVTGATGNVGGQVVSQLASTGAIVRALTRNPEFTGVPNGVEIVRGDLSIPESLDAAVDGVEAVFLVWPIITADHAAPETVERIAKHARRIVYLSAAGVPDDPHQPAEGIIGSHARMERLIEQSGLEWTFLRPGGFAANTLMWGPQLRNTDVVRWFHGGAKRSLIHEHDVAAVGVRVLTDGGHAGARYHLTGPEQLTQAEQVRTIGAAIGRPLQFEELPPDIARQELFAGMPPSMAESILGAHAEMVTNPEPVTSTVEEITGTPARTFLEWASDHAADFR